jgi:hypothetical protein
MDGLGLAILAIYLMIIFGSLALTGFVMWWAIKEIRKEYK